MILVELGGSFFPPAPGGNHEKDTQNRHPRKGRLLIQICFSEWVGYGVKSLNEIHFPLPFPPVQKDIKSSPPPQVNGGGSKPESESNKGKRVKRCHYCFWGKKRFSKSFFLQYNWKVYIYIFFLCLMSNVFFLSQHSSLFFGKLFGDSTFFFFFKVCYTTWNYCEQELLLCGNWPHGMCSLKSQTSIKHILSGHGGCIQCVSAVVDFSSVEQSYWICNLYDVTSSSKFREAHQICGRGIFSLRFIKEIN